MKDMLQIFWKSIAVTIAVILAQFFFGWALSPLFGQAWENMPAPSEAFIPNLIGTLITVLVLVYPALRSRLRGGRLMLALFLAVLGLNVVLTNIEAAIFLVVTPLQLWSGIVHASLNAAILAILVGLAFGRQKGEEAPNVPRGPTFTAGKWTRRIALSAFCYLVLYFAAGLLIISHIQAFYDTQNMEVGAWFLPLQLARGALYVGFVLYLLRNIAAPKWPTCLAMAFMFPILAGVASLLSPNPVMPDYVRYWHILEIGWSNLVYGFLVGFLFWNGLAQAGKRTVIDDSASLHKAG